MLRHCLLIASLLIPLVTDAENITIVLKDGRVISGQVDEERTAADRLWIRQTTSSLDVSSAFDWNDIARIPRFADEEPQHLVFATQSAPSRATSPVTWSRGFDSSQRSAPSRIRTIAFEATLANWDRDEEIDGIQLTVYPLDAKRRVVACKGAIYATLLSRNPEPLPKVLPIEVWSKNAKTDLANGRPLVVNLPFRQLSNPEERFYRAHGLLKVRLSVRGQGSFKAEGIIPLSEF